ncbi:hypothetical protein [Micromonospora sp. WMMD812]|nr:hypothetical protein [Micromonospora sp. WMMD812]WBB68586.1 hypothetical protein O7603_04185 [Micromonospora sp. WMMD812]
MRVGATLHRDVLGLESPTIRPRAGFLLTAIAYAFTGSGRAVRWP